MTTTTERARLHRSQGLCAYRCNRPARPNRATCEPCAAKQNQRQAALRGGYKHTPGSVGRPPLFKEL